jgi:hypothetical protein
LRRHTRYPSKFIQALSDFIQSYNQENVRIYEREHRQLRKDVTADDLEKVIALMDDYDATTVAHLLIAFGYARDSKDRQDLPTPTQDTDNNAEPSTEIQ